MMSSPQTNPDFTVLVLGNYQPDGQRSMQRFSGLLAEGLRGAGLKVVEYSPPVVVGKLGATVTGPGKWLGYLDKYLLLPFLLWAKLRSIQGTVIVHICDHSNAPYTRWLKKVPHVVTCHDLLAVRSALGEIQHNQPGWTGKQQQAMILRGLKRSQCIANVSGATRDDVARLVGNRAEWLHVIHNALDAAFIETAQRTQADTAQTDTLHSRLPNTDRYVMHIGGEKWYKNREAILKMYRPMAEVDPKLQLVIVGDRFSETKLKSTGCDVFSERIHYLSNISDAELRELYSAASMLLFPSHIEGFGWPILEAQACGCPVATLDRAPMNELNGIPELILDPNSDSTNWGQAAGSTCLQFIDQSPEALDTHKRAIKMFAAKFTNESAIHRYLELYKTLLTGKESRA